MLLESGTLSSGQILRHLSTMLDQAVGAGPGPGPGLGPTDAI